MQQCRLCGKSARSFLSLGRVPLPEEFRTKRERNEPIHTYPLGLSRCARCSHVQLTQTVSPDLIYKRHYFYDYSVTATGLAHWRALTKLLARQYSLKNTDLIVDIGSNTGTLLSIFQKQGFRVLGIDPARKLAAVAQKNGIATIVDYCTPHIAKRIVKTYGQATIIACTNVFDHVADLNEVTKAIKILLAPQGVCIIEVPYFYRMLKSLSHIVYHQQIDYMMLTPLIPFFQKWDLELVDAEEIPMHGGSIRLAIRHKGIQKPTKRFQTIVRRESPLFRNYSQRLKAFAFRIQKQRNALKDFVRKAKASGKTIAGIGASAKGITLLNYARLGPQEIDFITEKSPLKIGRFTPSGIPVLTDEKLMKQKPDYALLLAWNFSSEVMNNLKGYHGTWVVPLPKLKIVRSQP